MIKLFLSFLIIILPIQLFSSSLIEQMKRENDPLYLQIRRNIKDVSMINTTKVVYLIRKAAQKYNVDSKLLLAIFIQESKLQLDAINCYESGCDFGIAQINYKTADNFKFNKVRLLTDLEYSVISGAVVLADFKRMYGHKDKEYWTRYHSSDIARRKEYKNLVLKYM